MAVVVVMIMVVMMTLVALRAVVRQELGGEGGWCPGLF